ncbi:ATP-binding protein [Pedococcus sp. 2YAF34]|uniref:ATP-binding protein n=1 Tax=Pedococcus sp. 2YAF34 TaxID=3233032 RepID=UPI003F9681EB
MSPTPERRVRRPSTERRVERPTTEGPVPERPASPRLVERGAPATKPPTGSAGQHGMQGWYWSLPAATRDVLTFVVLLAGVFALMTTSVVLAPAGSHVAAWWPASGLSVVALLWTRGTRRWLMALGLLAISVVANLLGDRTLAVSIGYAVSNLLETVVVTLLLLRAGGARSTLASMAGLGKFLQACAAGAAVIAVGAGVTAAVSEGADLFAVGRAVGASHAAALLLVLPWFLGSSPAPERRRAERVAQWLVLVAVVVAVFAPRQSLPLAFVPFVPLMWGAVRMGQRTVYAQLVTAGVLATVLSALGGGPFAHISAGRPPEVVSMLVQAFVVCAALLVLPLSVAIRQRQETMTELQRSEALFRHGFNGARVGMLLLKREEHALCVVEINAVALRLLTGGDGRTEDDLLGQSWSQLLDPASARLVDDVLPAPVHGPLPPDATGWQGEVRVAPPSHAWLEVTLSPLIEYSADLYTAQLVDVTERRSAEEQLRSALEKERRAVERLTELDQAKDDFVTNISHELRTPITSVIGYAEMLATGDAGDLDRLQLGMVEKVQRNAGRLLSLIEDVLVVSRVDAGSFSFTLGRVDVRSCAWAACESLEKQALDAGLRLAVAAPSGSLHVLGDAAQLERALINLISNAIKFTPAGGEVTVRLRVDIGEVRIAVEDTGMGVPEAEAHRLFERFFRSSTAQSEAIQGTGLGLTIVSSIAHAHHGEVGYAPRPGGGSVFSITLPLADGPQKDDPVDIETDDVDPSYPR